MKTFIKSNLLITLLFLGFYLHASAQENIQKTVTIPAQTGTITMTENSVTVPLSNDVNLMLHNSSNSSYTIMITPIGTTGLFVKSKSDDGFVVGSTVNADSKNSPLKFDYVIFVTETIIETFPTKIYTSINDK
ncbi:MAG: hypothetical protein ACXVPU_08440 [Bacteroidia bacterium]